jgi:hypothetical protein
MGNVKALVMGIVMATSLQTCVFGGIPQPSQPGNAGYTKSK